MQLRKLWNQRRTDQLSIHLSAPLYPFTGASSKKFYLRLSVNFPNIRVNGRILKIRQTLIKMEICKSLQNANIKILVKTPHPKPDTSSRIYFFMCVWGNMGPFKLKTPSGKSSILVWLMKGWSKTENLQFSFIGNMTRSYEVSLAR